MLSLFLLLSFLVSPAHAAGEDGTVSKAAVETVTRSESDLRASAQVKQEVIPQLTARKIRAENRIKAAEKYFAGDLALPEAFPNWSDAPLTEPAFLVSALVTLDQAALARASERVSAAGKADALGGTQVGREWKRAMRLASEAEDQADALRRRFLVGCQAGIAQAPGLIQEALDAENARLSALSKSMELDADNPDPAVAARIQQVGVAQGRLWGLRDAAVHAMTVPGSDALEEWLDADLKIAHETPDSGVFHRLAMVVPLLDPSRQSDVLALQFAQETDELVRRQQQLEASASEVFPESQESLEQLLAEAQGERDAWHERLNSQDQANDGAPDALMALRRTVAETEHQVATARVDRLAEALEAHSVEQDRIELEKLENAQLQMDEARAEAEAAKGSQAHQGTPRMMHLYH